MPVFGGIQVCRAVFALCRLQNETDERRKGLTSLSNDLDGFRVCFDLDWDHIAMQITDELISVLSRFVGFPISLPADSIY